MVTARHLENCWHDQTQHEVWLAQADAFCQRFPEQCKPLLPLLAGLKSGGIATPRQWLVELVPLERAWSRGVMDHDILNTTTDSTTPKGATIPLVVVLDNLRSAFNVGSILRTAECLGVQKVYLGGYTARPDEAKTQKTAMGVGEIISWEACSNTTEMIQTLREHGYQILAAETGPAALNIGQLPSISSRCALVLGNERYGLDPHILALADTQVAIPMSGRKNSLNVGVAFGILGYAIREILCH